jgi:hypothetical protein
LLPTFNIDIEFTAPPFYRRLFAWVLDLDYPDLLSGCCPSASQQYHDSFRGNADYSMKIWAVSMLFFLPFLLYHVVMEITMDGQSIGRK